MKSIALFDFDNTLYDGFSYFELLAAQTKEGLLADEAVERANSEMARYKKGEIEYEKAIVILIDIYAEGLKGHTYEEAYRSAHRFYAASSKIYDFTKPVLDLLRPTHDLCLVTGEPQFVAEAIKELYNFDDYSSTQYEVRDGIFTGKVTAYHAHREEKHAAIRGLLENHDIESSLALGDSEGDIEMLGAVAHPICINATSGLREKADVKGWPCIHPNEVENMLRELLQPIPIAQSTAPAH